MKKVLAILLFCVLLMIVLGCSDSQPSTPDNTVKPVGEGKISMMKNNTINLNLHGVVGDILTANEQKWLHTVLENNPALFDGFENPNDVNIMKTMWHGEFPGKLLSGIAQTYLINNDPATKQLGDTIVEKFKSVQQPDGYLGPWPENARYNKDILNNPPGSTWGKWDTWGHYHCVYGLLRWYQITGNKDALDVAIKALDCVYDYFIVQKNTFASQNWGECNFAISHAFALMYEATGKKEYLDAAEYIVNTEWKTEYLDFYSKGILACDWITATEENKAFCQSNQTRWESLHTLETLCVLYRITGNERYQKALDSLWWGMIQYDRHNTGSFGTGEGANGDPYGDGSETCNVVAWTSLSIDYLKMSENSYVADELELSFYNAQLGTLLENNREFTYMNLSSGTRQSALIILEGHSFTGGRDMSCCQANGNRGITQVAEWALLTGTKGLYLNYYGESNMQTTTVSGNKVSLKQTTKYPVEGQVTIDVTVDKEEEFTLYLRIPTWSENTKVSVNGQSYQAQAGKYCEIKRVWKTGDTIKLDIDMQIHFWMAENNTIGTKTSVYYGPLLLSFKVNESIRATAKINISDMKQMIKTEGNGIVNFKTVTTTGKEIILTDYYSAGKDGTQFVSWIGTNKELEPISFNKNGNPIWNNK